MEYESTFKLFFKLDSEKFNEELQRKYNSPDTLKFEFKINDIPSFFYYDRFIFDKVVSVETKNAKLNGIFESLPKIAKSQYIRNTLVAEVKNTNELEGVFSSRKAIFELTEDLKKRKSDKIGSIVNKYMMLLDNKEEKEIASCKDVRTVYDNLFYLDNKSLISEKNKPDGIYFRTNFVGVYDELGALIHKGINGENAIIEAIQEALKIFNKEEVNPFIRLAIFHYIFEYAHPFYDGNGRIGRYLVSLAIKKERSDIFAFRVSSGINARKEKYYKAFKNTEDPRNRGDLSTFVYEFLDIFDKEYDDSIKYALEKKKKMNELIDAFVESDTYDFSKNEKSILYILIQAHVFSDFGVTVKDIKDITNISDKTIRRSLAVFKEKGMLAEDKEKKTVYYNLKDSSLLEKQGEIVQQDK